MNKGGTMTLTYLVIALILISVFIIVLKHDSDLKDVKEEISDLRFETESNTDDINRLTNDVAILQTKNKERKPNE
jgi:cell division protein FtsL